jgi:hypothetical protein
MKPRNLAVFFALIVMICSAPVVARPATPPSPVASAPEVVVREFYAWYIHSVSHQIDPLKAGKATLKKYVTLRLILKVEKIAKDMAAGGYDSDYFLEAQASYPDSANLEDEWLKNVSVSKGVIKGATAAVTISFGENGALAKERVSLILAGGVWKIDSVKAISP